VSPIYWCKQIKTKNAVLRSKAGVSMLGLNKYERICNPDKNVRMSAANKGVLSTARSEEGSEILTRSLKRKTQHNVLGFLFLNEVKTCFDKYLKQKDRK
jgi:hypothetical protein